MKFFTKSLIPIFFILFLFTSVHASNEKDEEDKNLKYLINSIDIENKKINPATPENEFQEVMGEYMKNMTNQNVKAQKSLSLIGPIEFEAVSDLANVENIQIFKENLKQYKKVKKNHYDTLDILMRNANTRIGKVDLAKKGLEVVHNFMKKNWSCSFSST